jgi:uncharacterized protein YjhX (UPF0386 family)
LDISKAEQRVLHALAQGGSIHALKDHRGAIAGVECYNRHGWLMPEVGLRLFTRLRNRQAIASSEGRPYRITRRGLELVRGQLDNR